MSTTFRGRVSQIAGDLVQVWDAASGHSVYLPRGAIRGGDHLRLNDEVIVEGDGSRRTGHLLAGNAKPSLADAALD